MATSTRRTYQTGVTAYYSFCAKYGIPSLPASETTLRYFCTHLSSSVSYQTIMVYLAGVRLLHLEHGFPDPTKAAPLLHYLCTAIRRSGMTTSKKRQPITLPLLKTIKTELSHANLPSQDKLAYWAAFTLAFYGFLRASEYTAPSTRCFNPGVHLLVKDITITSDSIKLLLKRSKTDKFGKSATVLIGSTSTSTCPVKAMQKFLSIRQREPPGPLFVLQSGKNVTRRLVSEMTQSLLRSAGLDWQCYSSHSYRIGAATTAASAGLPDHLIKTLGRWRSNAYQDYIRTSPKILCRAAAQMH